jgi:hypothetical protein
MRIFARRCGEHGPRWLSVLIDAAGVIHDSWIADDAAIAPSLNLIFTALRQMAGGQDEEARHA